MKVLSRRRKKGLFKLAIVGLIISTIFIFIGQQIKIKHKREELEEINEQILVEKNRNDKINGEISEAKNSNNSHNREIRKRVFENIAQ